MLLDFGHDVDRPVALAARDDPHGVVDLGQGVFGLDFHDGAENLEKAADALSQVDTDALPPAEAVDCTVLLARVERTLFELTEVREHEWNPLEHNPGPLLHGLLARQFAPGDERLASLGGRPAAVPVAVGAARGVPGGMPGTAAALTACVAAMADLPEGTTFSATGIGRTTLPVLLASLASGGHLRVGLGGQPAAGAEPGPELAERL